MNVSMASLISFINAQPAEREIDHAGAWDTCVIAHFKDEVGVNLSATDIAEKLHHENGTSRQRLHYCYGFPLVGTEPTLMDHLALADGQETYGQLRARLAEHL